MPPPQQCYARSLAELNWFRLFKFRSELSSTRRAFTLAEVLITLGIIGVVAALTIPALITKHQKSVAENRVKKFYSTINQAIKMSEVANGEISNWLPEKKFMTFDENVNFLKTYILPYFNYTKVSDCTIEDGNHTYAHVCVYLTDGEMFTFNTDTNGSDIHLFLNGKPDEKTTRNFFAFQLNKQMSVGPQNSVEPYTYNWDGNYETLKGGHARSCTKTPIGTSAPAYCTKLLQMNGWKINSEYPW